MGLAVNLIRKNGSVAQEKFGNSGVENKPASLLVPLGKALSGVPHLGVVDRWLVTPKRARVEHQSLSRDRTIIMQQIQKKLVVYLFIHST